VNDFLGEVPLSHFENELANVQMGHLGEMTATPITAESVRDPVVYLKGRAGIPLTDEPFAVAPNKLFVRCTQKPVSRALHTCPISRSGMAVNRREFYK
jgi:hypothetical protein